MDKLQCPYEGLMGLNIPVEGDKCVLIKKKHYMAGGNVLCRKLK